jgi:hypothetical protein
MAKTWKREIQNPQISSQIQSFSRAIIFILMIVSGMVCPPLISEASGPFPLFRAKSSVATTAATDQRALSSGKKTYKLI